jgi:hypothetical protein
MERFRLHIPRHASFLPCDAQSVSHDAQLHGIGIDPRREGFHIHRIFILIKVDEGVTPGGLARQKRRAEKRLATGARLVEHSVELPTQRVQGVPRMPVCHGMASFVCPFGVLVAGEYFCMLDA